MGVQFISTPLHLLGLDLYNNKGSTTGQRVQYVLSRARMLAACLPVGYPCLSVLRSLRLKRLCWFSLVSTPNASCGCLCSNYPLFGWIWFLI